MKIAVVTAAMSSGERGGAEAFYAGLLGGLRSIGVDAHQVDVRIDESTFEAVLASYKRCYDLDLRQYDLVISTKAPTYMVRHPRHVSYLVHTLRVFYDRFASEFGEGNDTIASVSARRFMRWTRQRCIPAGCAGISPSVTRTIAV